MKNDTAAADAFVAWAPKARDVVMWTRTSIEGCPGFALDVPEPFAAVLVARKEHWELLLTTARGQAYPYLGAIDDEPAVIFDALLYAIYARAQHELDYRNRAASAALGVLLRELARCADDARYGGRAAMLLGSHAAKEQLHHESAVLLRQAVTLFTAADDITAADSASAALDVVLTQQGS